MQVVFVNSRAMLIVLQSTVYQKAAACRELGSLQYQPQRMCPCLSAAQIAHSLAWLRCKHGHLEASFLC